VGDDVAAPGGWALTALDPEVRVGFAPHRLTNAASHAAATLAQLPSRCVRGDLRPDFLAPTLDSLLQDLGADEHQRQLLTREVTPVLAAAMDALGAPSGLLRLEVVRDRSCPKWHVDRLRLRLGCTLHGAGTEYLPPGMDPDSAGATDSKHVPSATFFAMAGSGAGPGLWHRSPHACDQHPRLFLALDVR
jgi:hypothetical protein